MTSKPDRRPAVRTNRARQSSGRKDRTVPLPGDLRSCAMPEPITLESVVVEVQKVLAAADEILDSANEDECNLRNLARQLHRLDHAQLGRIHRHYGEMLDVITTFELLLHQARDRQGSTRQVGSVARLEDKAQQVRDRLSTLCALVAELRSHPPAATAPGLLPS